MRITQEMFDPIPLDDDPVLDGTFRPFGRDQVGGLCRALESDQVSVSDRVHIESLLEKIQTGGYAVDPFAMGDELDPRRTLAVYAAKYAGASDPDVLAKRRGSIDPKNVVIGMKVRGHDGTIGTISKIRGASVTISFPNGEGVSLIEHLKAA